MQKTVFSTRIRNNCRIFCLLWLISTIIFIIERNSIYDGYEENVANVSANNTYRISRSANANNEVINEGKNIRSFSSAINSNSEIQNNIKPILCRHLSCIQAANEIHEKMDTETAPCDDFHKFSCGQFTKDTTIPHDDTFGANNDLVLHQIKVLLTEPHNDREVVAMKEAKNFYASCLDEDELNSNSQFNIHLLISALGGWRILDKTEASLFNWKTYTFNFLKNGIIPNHFLSFLVKEKSGIYTFQVFYPKLSLPVNILRSGWENEIVRTYYKFMKNVTSLLGASDKAIDDDLSSVLDLEIKLAQNMDEDFDDSITDWKILQWESHHFYTTIEQATLKYPHIPWLDIVRNHLPINKFITENNPIVIPSLPWFRGVMDVLRYESKSILANYVMWRAISKIGIVSSPQINEIFHHHFKGMANIFEKLPTIFGEAIVLKDRPRWLDCIDATINSYWLVLNHVYAKRFFNQKSKQLIQNISIHIKHEMANAISQTTLMGEQIKFVFRRILHGMIICIGYHDQLMDSNRINEHYAKIPIKPNGFLEKYLTMKIFEIHHYYSKLFKSVERCDDLAPLSNYQIYRWSTKELIIAARFLQGTLVNVELPLTINLGAIGVHIARLMLFSVVDEFLGDDIKSMWGGQSYENVSEIERCTRNELGNLETELQTDEEPIENANFNTVTETIMDAIALKVVYRVHQKWLKNSNQLTLPEFQNYSHNQLFWMIFGSVNCGKNERYLFSRIRVIMAARNQVEFAQDFSCPKNSTMNPSKRCNLWR